jgi:hypothetical protein
MRQHLTNRQLLTAMITLASVMAFACLLLGLAAGHGILRSLGLANLAVELDSIPVWSVIVAFVGVLVVLAIGVGLCLKGLGEGRMKATVRGTIRSTTVRAIPGDNPEFGLFSKVSYCIDGVVRCNEGMHHATSSTESDAKGRLATLPSGAPVTVYYGPADPDVIVLDAPPSGTAVVLWVGIWLMASGLGAMFLNGVVLAK